MSRPSSRSCLTLPISAGQMLLELSHKTFSAANAHLLYQMDSSLLARTTVESSSLLWMMLTLPKL